MLAWSRLKVMSPEGPLGGFVPGCPGVYPHVLFTTHSLGLPTLGQLPQPEQLHVCCCYFEFFATRSQTCVMDTPENVRSRAAAWARGCFGTASTVMRGLCVLGGGALHQILGVFGTKGVSFPSDRRHRDGSATLHIKSSPLCSVWTPVHMCFRLFSNCLSVCGVFAFNLGAWRVEGGNLTVPRPPPGGRPSQKLP